MLTADEERRLRTVAGDPIGPPSLASLIGLIGDRGWRYGLHDEPGFGHLARVRAAGDEDWHEGEATDPRDAMALAVLSASEEATDR